MVLLIYLLFWLNFNNPHFLNEVLWLAASSAKVGRSDFDLA